MRNQILLGQPLKYWIMLPGVVAGLFAITVSAFAFGLSDDDYDYLATTQHVESCNPPVLDISPQERPTPHYLINDPKPPVIRLRATKTSRMPCSTSRIGIRMKHGDGRAGPGW